MQKTNFSRITYQLNNLYFGFLSDTSKPTSIGLIAVLTGKAQGFVYPIEEEEEE